MQSFYKMVKEKRATILILVILLFALNSVYKANGLKVPDLVQFTKKSVSGDEGICITFDYVSSAVEWSYPIPDDATDLPEIASSYLPTDLLPPYGNKFENELQDDTWKIQNWTISTHTANNYVPIIDSRWEDFRTYFSNSNETRMIENRVEIPRNAKIGISIRSDATVNILLCEGFNPKNYPCYTIILGGKTKKDVYIQKYGMEKNISEYESKFQILSNDEWKNFQILTSNSGNIQLKDIIGNTTYANVTDPTPLKTLYLFVNSTSPALWKLHKNNFLFTNTSQTIPFGPPINANTSTICLSMYMMMCKSCFIYFYTVKNSSQEIVLEVLPRNDSIGWENIKIIIENVTADSEQLYVKTHGDAMDRFWAIDNVRHCIIGEFKMTKLAKRHYNQTLRFEDPSFSCHLLKSPEWRPKKQIISSAEFPAIEISPNSTSIELSWKKSYPQPYLIKYKGYDKCANDTISQHKNKQRLKSNDWMIVKPKQTSLKIDNLIPHTYYDVHLIDPIYEDNKTYTSNTKFSDILTKEEISSLIITPGINQTKIFLALKCNISYGPVVYKVDVIQKPNPSPLIDSYTYTIRNLEPFTNYTLSLTAARTTSNLNNASLILVTFFNFTTKPDVAPAIKAEIYEASQKSVSFRYRLPDKPKGIPKSIRVAVCNPILRENCTYQISNITSCKLWRNQYCIIADSLMKNTSYTFKLSIKNKNTNTFGEDVVLNKDTIESVPAAPINISYKIINCSDLSEYCNLNISWCHPYMSGGVISSFEVFLQNGKEVILDNVPVNNKEYLPIYWHTIKYLPYAKTYNLTIRAVNMFHKGSNVTTTVKIDHIAQHIDQVPKLIENNGGKIVFLIPPLDYRLNSSIITVIVQQNDGKHVNIPKNLITLAQNDLCLNNTLSWTAGIWKATSKGPTKGTIENGVNLKSNITNDDINNKPLLPNIVYCINFVITTVYKSETHVRVYHETHVMLSESQQNLDNATISTGSIIVIILLIILVATVVAFVTYKVRKQRGINRLRRGYGEHIYESMPPDDLDYNVVYNAMYDKLNHDQ